MEFRIPSGMVWALGLLGGLTAIILPISHGAQRAPSREWRCPRLESPSREISIPSSPIQALKVQNRRPRTGTMFRKNPPHEMAEMDPEGRSRAVESEVPP